MNEIRYLDLAGAIAINSHFSDSGVRDLNAVRSAVGEPQQGAFGVDFHPTLDNKSAALFRGLARNHGFVDGNKRTALTGTDVFLRANGFALDVQTRPLVDFTLAAAQGELDLDEMSAQISQWRRPVRQVEQCALQSVVRVLALR